MINTEVPEDWVCSQDDKGLIYPMKWALKPNYIWVFPRIIPSRALDLMCNHKDLWAMQSPGVRTEGNASSLEA